MNENEPKSGDEVKEILDKSDAGPPDAVVNAAGKRCNCNCKESSRR